MQGSRKGVVRRRGNEYCLFERGGVRFALPIGVTREVLSGLGLSRIEGAPPEVLGGALVREVFTPVLCIDEWLGTQGAPYEPTNHVLVFEQGNLRFGCSVDRVREIRPIDPEAWKPFGETPRGPLLQAVAEFDDGPVALVDAAELARRAAQLRARVPAWQPTRRDDTARRVVEPTEELCLFERGRRLLALPVRAAREVLTEEPLTPLPQAPPHVAGALNLRGEILPVVLMDAWLDLPAREFGLTDQVLVVEDGDVRLGLVVDRVRDVRAVKTAEIQTLGAAGGLFRGYWPGPDGLVTVLASDRLVREAVARSAEAYRQGLRLPQRVGGQGPEPAVQH